MNTSRFSSSEWLGISLELAIRLVCVSTILAWRCLSFDWLKGHTSRMEVNMSASRFSISEWLGISLELLSRVVWVSTILAIGVWLWPEGILATRFTAISLGMALWAIGSVIVVTIGLAAVYFAVVEPYLDVYLDLKREDRNSPSEHL